MNKLRFYAFHLMPYPYFPPAEEIQSSWVSLPNSHYDPHRGRVLYNEYIDQLVAAESYGYDGVGVNEHHANFYGTMPSPNIIAAMLVQRTKHIPIGVIGNAIPLHGNPLRVAEEIAMLDVISGGRIISGFVRGIGCEYFNNPVPPADSTERFAEAHDLIIKAWTDDGPFTWQGDHFYIPNVNIIPRPIQQPHPPIWIPGQGSLETLQFIARHRYTYMMVFSPLWFTKMAFDGLREECARLGYEADKNMFNACVPTYVAETDAQAHREAKAHLSWVFNTGLKIPDQFFFPPGYMSTKSFRNFMGQLMKGKVKPQAQLSYDELLADRYIIVGSPETVKNQLGEYVETVGAGGMIGAGSPFGPMPNWMVMKNMQMYAEEVIPEFREADGLPDYMRTAANSPRSHAELAARYGRPPEAARSRVTGGDQLIDHRLAHVAEVIDPTLDGREAERPASAG
ncbi:MAG: LLM class flavin-dependent oxidoreductase [Gammaproteobacteria bacterium]|nr:LLM class flavin-dependent oxidoreductase [Gammaproteobacteria bacterium]MCP5201564.1 LLM class flavin-dependent oxidoreductase [Gammaproteobacteria bacterium]